MKSGQKTHTGGSYAELNAHTERWQLALDGAGEGVWDWDPVANKVFYSHQWKAMLGYSPEELIGMHVLQAHSPHRRGRVGDTFDARSRTQFVSHPPSHEIRRANRRRNQSRSRAMERP